MEVSRLWAHIVLRSLLQVDLVAVPRARAAVVWGLRTRHCGWTLTAHPYPWTRRCLRRPIRLVCACSFLGVLEDTRAVEWARQRDCFPEVARGWSILEMVKGQEKSARRACCEVLCSLRSSQRLVIATAVSDRIYRRTGAWVFAVAEVVDCVGRCRMTALRGVAWSSERGASHLLSGWMEYRRCRMRRRN